MKRSAEAIAAHLQAGRDVALLSEGDPLFYGSFMHLFVRLEGALSRDASCRASPACPAAWRRRRRRSTWGDDVPDGVAGNLAARFARRNGLQGCNAVAIMKVGRNLAKVRAALTGAGLLDRAIYVERATMDNEIIAPSRAKDRR